MCNKGVESQHCNDIIALVVLSQGHLFTVHYDAIFSYRRPLERTSVDTNRRLGISNFCVCAMHAGSAVCPSALLKLGSQRVQVFELLNVLEQT